MGYLKRLKQTDLKVVRRTSIFRNIFNALAVIDLKYFLYSLYTRSTYFRRAISRTRTWTASLPTWCIASPTSRICSSWSPPRSAESGARAAEDPSPLPTVRTPHLTHSLLSDESHTTRTTEQHRTGIDIVRHSLCAHALSWKFKYPFSVLKIGIFLNVTNISQDNDLVNF